MVILAVSLVLGLALAPRLVWQRTYLSGCRDEAVAITCSHDCGLIVVGERSHSGYQDDVLAVKMDSKGHIIWNKTYGGGDWDSPCNVVQCEDGYLLAGGTGSFGPHNQIYLVRINEQGAMLWNRTYQVGMYGCQATDIEVIEDGFVITGLTAGDIFLLRTDQEARPVWNKTYGGIGQDLAQDVLPCSDGGFLVTGGMGDIYLIKVDAEGETTWERRLGTPFHEIGNSAAEQPNGGYLVIGDRLVEPELHYEMYLVEVDPLGQVAWNRTIEAGKDCHGHEIVSCPGKGYYIAGSEGVDLSLRRIDDQGKVKWSRRFRGKCFYPPGVVCTPDGGLAVTSTSDPYGHNFSIHVVKMTFQPANLPYWLLPLTLIPLMLLLIIAAHRQGWLANAISWLSAMKQSDRHPSRDSDTAKKLESFPAKAKSLLLEVVGYFVPIFQFLPAVGIYAGIMSLPLIGYLLSYSLLPHMWRQLRYMFLDFNFVLWQPVWKIPLRTLLPIVLRKSLLLGGLTLLLIAIAFRIKHRRELATTGPYRRVRHPQYLGIIIMTFGMNLYVLETQPIIPIRGFENLEVGTYFIILVWVLQVAAYIVLAKIEERHLSKTIGPRYQKYRESVPFIIPFTKPRKNETE